MNIGYSLRIVGRIMRVVAALMLLPALVSAIYRDGYAVWFILSSVVILAVGLLPLMLKTADKNIYAREGFFIVAATWILISLFGALPFYLSGQIPSYLDAVFETVSGFTTTGASILTDVESLAPSMLFWRSFTHWVGGMGVLVFAFAIISLGDTRVVHILRAESPGPTYGKLVSKSKINAQILYGIYIALTVLEFLLLACGGMPVFDAMLNAFGTAGTGGFGIKNTSIGYYNSAYVDCVIGIFMMLFGVNFSVYFLLLRRRLADVFRSEELRWYLGIIAFSTITIAANIMPIYKTVSRSLRYAFFQVSSIITTTGYTTADFNGWPTYSQAVLLALMFVGGCVGSTAGGLKVMRIIIMIKTAIKEIRYSLDPRSVSSVMLDKKPLDRSVVTGVSSYIVTYSIIFFVSILLVSTGGHDPLTTITSVIACFNNVGPGLGVVGPAGNFSSLSALAKVVLTFDMLAGRLEIFPLLIWSVPSAWRK